MYLAVAFAFLAVLGQPADTAGPLAHLQTLADDESALVEAVRKLDQREIRLAKWDMEMAEQHRVAGEAELADQKAAQARERLQRVAKAYEFVLERYPDNPRALNYYGELAYDYLGQDIEALRSWRRAVELDPNLAPAHNNLGIYYCHVGKYDEGFRHLDKALANDADNPDILFNMAQMYLVYFPEVERMYGKSRKEIYQEAMQFSKKAGELSPKDYELLVDYAVNHFAGPNFGVEVDWSAAAEAWERARVRAPNADQRFYTWLNQARALIRGEFWDRADKALRAALEIRPDSLAAQRLLDDVKEARALKRPN